MFEIIMFQPIINSQIISSMLTLAPFIIFFELPWTLFVVFGMFKYKRALQHERYQPHYPAVSCIVCCYSEGKNVIKTIESLLEQIYPGKMEIIIVVDGAKDNQETLFAAKSMMEMVRKYPNRTMKILPKWVRGGLVSGANLGLRNATGEIVIRVDGDSSFDNNMVERAARHFKDPSVVGVSGNLRVRNADKTIWTKLQSIEYFLGITSSKTALSAFNMVNNISGAFGIFRKSIIQQVQGWDAGTAEDLDITLRVKAHFTSELNYRIVFDHESVCHTDVPETLHQYLKQRMRWEGDYYYIVSKHLYTLRPKYLGWPNFIGAIIRMITNLVLPPMNFLFLIVLFVFYPMAYSIALLLVVYIFYLVLNTALYILTVVLFSERPEEDWPRIIYLPLMPLFMVLSRLNAFLANIWEVVGCGHKDSTMAPWWVLRKTKF